MFEHVGRTLHFSHVVVAEAVDEMSATQVFGIRALHSSRRIEREIGMARLERALPVIESVAHVAEQDILVTAAEKYTVLRRLTPRFLDAFRFQSSTPNDPVLAAVELLRTRAPAGSPNDRLRSSCRRDGAS